MIVAHQTVPPISSPPLNKVSPCEMSQHPSAKSSASVFKALGSYADRIKEAGVKSPPQSSLSPRGTSPQPANSPVASGSVSPPSANATRNSTAHVDAKTAVVDDGSWETVHTTRHRSRPERPERAEESRGSNSRNWRERDEKVDHGKDRSVEGSLSGKRGSGAVSTSAPPTVKAHSSTTPRSVVSTLNNSKPAWGLTSPMTAQQATLSLSVTREPLNGTNIHTEPSSPLIDGTGIATSLSVPPSIGSPESTANIAASVPTTDCVESEGSWRQRPKITESQPTMAALIPKTAAPPTVNAWDLRKKQLVPTNEISASPSRTPKPSAPAVHFGTVNSTATGNSTQDVKVGGKKMKKKTAAVEGVGAAPPPIADATLWPDVSQAAEVTKFAEEKKSSKNDKKENEPPVATDDIPLASTKKQKWTPIPASELQEAADKAAAAVSRSNKTSKRSAKADSDLDHKSPRGRKSVGGENGKKTPRLSESQDENRLSSVPEALRGTQSSIVTEALGPRQSTANAPDKILQVVEVQTDHAIGGSAPMSRQTSNLQSNIESPDDISSKPPVVEKASLGTETPNSAAQGIQVSSPPIPQQASTASTNATLPRGPAPRSRDGRGIYPNRGRGSFRGTSAVPMSSRMYTELPALSARADYSAIYPPTYAVAYPAFYPTPHANFVMAAAYDPVQATYSGMQAAGRTAMPPPPMPVTQIANLDPLRYYVLGQVEYYFSMQNLAMDFFLRQQMDSEGWIDIAMIASFNRVKSLTPDVSMVREVMSISSLLELREDKVRLNGPEAKRWVLPDSKISKFAPNPASQGLPIWRDTTDAVDIAKGIPGSVNPSAASILGIEDILASPHAPKFDVENALMKSSGSMPVSSTTSILNGDDNVDKSTTPATSDSGDGQTSDRGEEKLHVELH